MPFAFLLALASVAGATLLTYLFDRDAHLWSRLCAGVCIGFALLGLVGFVNASWLGMTTGALVLSGLFVGSPLLLLWRGELRERVRADSVEAARDVRRAVARPGRGTTGTLVFYLVAALLFWLVFDRAMYRTTEGIFTGVDTNIGDLPFHLAVISGFAYGENFPPQHPEFAGVRLTYPFVVDFVTAMFVRAGASLQGAMFWQNFAMMLSLTGLLQRWALKLTRERVAALLTPALVLLSGGLGWWVFLAEALKSGRGVFGLLGSLEHDYTIMGDRGYRWGNALTALFITQRGIVLGVALAVVVWTLWWDASEKGEGRKAKGESEETEGAASRVEARSGGGQKKGKRSSREAKRGGKEAMRQPERGPEILSTSDSFFALRLPPFAFTQMIAAGLLAGLLPLVHAHSFVVMMSMGMCLAVLQAVVSMFGARRNGGSVEEWAGDSVFTQVWRVWRPWLAFAVAASVVSVPQMFWATRESAVRAGQFFGWEFGWDHGAESVAWFWLKNTGVFIPLLVAALAWRGREPLVSRRLLYFYLPFVLCFVVPNVYKLSPWVWDNIKVLFYWWIASAPLVALVLARLWRRGAVWRAVAVGLLLAQTAAGGLDVWRAASGTVERRTFDAAGITFAELVRRETPPRSLILHAPTYNDPVYLTGRRTFLGYPGHVWSHGIDYAAREAELKSIYAGAAEAPGLIAKEGIEYVVVGPLEREELRKYGVTINEAFFRRFKKVGEAGEYRLYKTSP
jgi:hypothetical protein